MSRLLLTRRASGLYVPADTPGITIGPLNPAAASVAQGASVDVTVPIARQGGYAGLITLTPSGLPADVTPTWPAGNTAAEGVSSRVLRLTPDADAAIVTADAYEVTASAAGVASSVANGTVTVTSSDALAYTNQPAGMTPFFEFNGSQTPVLGTLSFNWFKPNSAFNVNASALNPPRSPNNVMRLVFDPPGINGDGAGDLFFTPPANTQRVYTCQWIRWSDNWRWHPGGAKLFFWRSNYGPARIHAYFPVGNIDTGPARHRVQVGSGDVDQSSTYYLQRGQWHKIETLAVMNTASASNGSYRIWVDGVLVWEDTAYQWWPSNTTFASFELISTQGGGSVSYPAQQWYDTDHIFISTSTSRS